MSSGGLCYLLPVDIAGRIALADREWGFLRLVDDPSNDLVGVQGFTAGDDEERVSVETAGGHPLFSSETVGLTGGWLRAPAGTHGLGRQVRVASLSLPVDGFRAMLADAEGAFLTNRIRHLMTYEAGARQPWAGWEVSGEFVRLVDLLLLPRAAFDPRNHLDPVGWPLDRLESAQVTVVGVGSIGSAAAHALAAYGVRRMTLVDPDRLRAHNIVRHQSGRVDIGQYKVDSVARAVSSRWPGTHITALRMDVIEDATRVRPLFARSSIVVGATDGVAPRRVISHLARKAATTAVLACVLEDGAIGEVLRLRPWPTRGCLLCQRAALIADGALDPEPAIDAEYGSGTTHRPMTAVGADLHLVGQLAAKIAVATLLEEAGIFDQRIPEDYALVGLRATRDAPPPFDVGQSELSWYPAVPARPDCPTCSSS